MHLHRGAVATRPRPGWWSLPVDRSVVVALTRRSRQVLLLAGLTGLVTGLVVAGFEELVADVALERALRQPLAVRAVLPFLGLLAAAGALRLARPPASPETADEYVRDFHDRSGRLDLRLVPVRLLAAVATLGTGSPLGYEGPALYAGAGIGTRVEQRFRRWFPHEDAKVLVVAGAAAGVSAIFKAPVTGIVFALEVPYRDDLARRMLLPAAISAAASYVAFAAIAGTDPILPVTGQPPFDLRDLGGAAVVGVLCGVLARAFVRLVRAAKTFAGWAHPLARIAAAGAVLAAAVVLGDAVGHEPLILGPGYDALRWALAPERSVAAVVALGTLRVAATGAAIGGGGVGGLFIPLVMQGALVGRAVGGVFDADQGTLFPVVGMAAFLGAGYGVPLAAVVFVAEFTGRPGFVVPGLVAAVVAQLAAGRSSVSKHQAAGRVGHLEARLALPLATVVDTAARTVPPDATVEELFWQHLVAERQRSAVVVDGDRYVGLAGTEQLGDLDRARWATTTVADVMRTDVAAASPAWSLRDAIVAMDAGDTDRLAVCDAGGYVGVITAAGIVELGEVLGRGAGEVGA